MEKKYIVALDQGTTSSRAIVFNSNAKKYSKPGIPDMKAYEIGYVGHTDKVIKGEFKGCKEMTQFI